MATNNNVALILVDYTARAGLKIFAKASIIELIDVPSLLKLLDLAAYTFGPKRMMVLDMEACDWKCPQHITQRYTVEDIETAYAPKRVHTSKLAAEVIALKAKLK